MASRHDGLQRRRSSSVQLPAPSSILASPYLHNSHILNLFLLRGMIYLAHSCSRYLACPPPTQPICSDVSMQLRVSSCDAVAPLARSLTMSLVSRLKCEPSSCFARLNSLLKRKSKAKIAKMLKCGGEKRQHLVWATARGKEKSVSRVYGCARLRNAVPFPQEKQQQSAVSQCEISHLRSGAIQPRGKVKKSRAGLGQDDSKLYVCGLLVAPMSTLL